MNLGREILPLKSEKSSYFYNKGKLQELKEELEEFLENDGKYMNNREFATKFLNCQEIQTNNSVEGYNDDASKIDHYKNLDQIKRISNLYKGYKYILEGKEINAVTLKGLYDILSDGLLEEYDKNNMGAFYRNDDVHIYYSRNVEILPDDAPNFLKLEDYMNSLFSYLNDSSEDTITDYYIKSQVAHYYFVYVHPYFDVNGRTSRTMAMWYLLNNGVYPYVIFNRAIDFARTHYSKIIRETKHFGNLTYFLNFMLENVEVELEKEYVINCLEKQIGVPLSEDEYQNLRYILSFHGLKTAKGFCNFYNNKCEKKSFSLVKEDILDPLIDKGVIVTKSVKSSDNYIFDIADNPDINPKYVKKLRKRNKY